MHIRTFGLVALTAVLLCAPAVRATSEATAEPEGPMRVVRDIPYISIPNVDLDLTSLDVYAPNDADDAPVLIFVHGGGWGRGDKEHVRKKPEAFVGAGYVFVSVNYRLSPDVVHPAHVTDVAGAIAWVHDHISKYGGDPGRIYLMGHSAGAHLVSLVAVDETYLSEKGKSLGVVKGVVSLDTAAYDIPQQMDHLRTRLTRRIYEKPFTKDVAVQRNASPMTHVAPDKGIPPFLVVHAGSRDASRERGRAFVDALCEAGVSAELLAAPGKNHMTLNRGLGGADDDATAGILRFLGDLAPDGGAR